ncbi:acetyl-CoA carboxylase, carboxyl transferase, alpha subunit [Methylocella silvestris BL2]|uniref:Acetyl-coenzyme A carboxylase carboxyl transferase subunit alpha n=1 Tax=Methylocella silvestris (strain DSM 15510 / CIP 108128 / LMG 27833 / NCIMB 13906 / BL2) TaxID=395965 RepID=B8EN13_METSB|nr:acetyl-CoA carboxylase carboxyltransferase subunit alpha [Methylocella silvestris]ACK49148.1 acetyl-CoA carboxylase, carboxyl transferase, alpha subunit [Methylocella silvestris BL2]
MTFPVSPQNQASPRPASTRSYLDFEKPVAELEAKVQELRSLAADGEGVQISDELFRLESKSEKALADLYASLTPWQKTQVARHPQRPHFVDYVKGLITDFSPLSGDRQFGEDAALICGLGWFRGYAVCVMGQEKGTDTAARIKHNFGMARPEGYRKAVRVMQLAARFNLPVISLVDTPGAFPGVDAEERGQAEAIARATDASLSLGVPNIAAIVGEGGSGGAIAIATCNRVLMLEHAIYTVASPEASASILWRDAAKAEDAATTMKITAQDLYRFGIIDAIIAEPIGGAHRDPAAAIQAVGDAVQRALEGLLPLSHEEIRRSRADKFLAIGRTI